MRRYRKWKDDEYNPNKGVCNIAPKQKTEGLDKIDQKLASTGMRFTYSDLVWLSIQCLCEQLNIEIEDDFEAHGHVSLSKVLANMGREGGLDPT